MYNHVLCETFKEPTSVEYWIEMFPFMARADWPKIFLLTKSILKQPYFQNFQYKILNRILNCNQKLKIWKIKKTDECVYCKEVDTLCHHLYDCTKTKELWENLQIWMKNHLEISWPLTICEIIFGIPSSPDTKFTILNFIVV